MDNQLLEIGVKFMKGVVYTMKWCFRSVCNHPFLVVFVCFFLLLHRSFPLIFSLLVWASPVLVCTAVLLGILLSYGQPHIPEIEVEERKTKKIVSREFGISGDVDVVEKNERRYVEGFGEEKEDGLERAVRQLGEPRLEHDLDETALLILERSREVQFDDDKNGKVDRGFGDLEHENKFEWEGEEIRDGEVTGDHFASIAEEDEENVETDDEDSEAESFGSEKVNVDSLDSPPHSPWTRVVEVGKEDGEDDDVDSGSDRAESSSPDASMAEIMPMLDELHPLLDEETPQPVDVSSNSSDAASERSSTSSHESDDEIECLKDLEGEDEEKNGGEAIMWTEEDQKNLMELRSSEIERNQRLENLIMRRTSGRKLGNGIGNHNDLGVAKNGNEDSEDDEEDGPEDDKEEQTDSPIAWTEEDQKNLMELHSSEIERNQRLENIIMRRGKDHKFDNDIVNHDDVGVVDDDNEDGEDEDDGQEDKEEESKSPIVWTVEDQKNVMDLGWSEIERNQRLENLILRRRARKNTSTFPDKNLASLESYDLPFNIAPISTKRRNPFDLPDDSSNNSGLPPVPGSAPSVLLPRRNPFDIPYDSNEEKPDLLRDEFQEEFTPTVQPREQILRKYETFNIRSRFARQRHDENEVKMRPYFVPEQTFSEESSYSQFQRQSSELSDSKVSSVPETDSVSSLEDLESRKLLEEDSLEVEVNSESIEVIEEYQLQEPEPISIVDGVVEHVRHGSESSEEEHSIELGQVRKGDVEASGIHFHSQDVEGFHQHQHMEVLATDYHSISDTFEERYNGDSSSSSHSEVSERVFTSKDGEGILIPQDMRDDFSGEPGISVHTSTEYTALATTSTLVSEIPYRVPVYDSSPRGVEESFPSSSTSTDVHPVDDPGFPTLLVKRTVSSTEKESEGICEEMETRITRDIEILAESWTAVPQGHSKPIDVVDTRAHNKEIDELIFKHLNEVQTSSVLAYLSEDVPTMQKSIIPETLELDQDVPSNFISSLYADGFGTTSSHPEVQKIVEEVDDIKEIDGLLSELDSIGDFGSNQWASSSREFDKHEVSAGENLSSANHDETGTACATGVNSFEWSMTEGSTQSASVRDEIHVQKKIDHVSELQTSKTNTSESNIVSEVKLNGGYCQGSPDGESSQVEAISKENEVKHMDIDSVPEKTKLACVETELLVADTMISSRGGMPELTASSSESAEEIKKSIILETNADLLIGETTIEHSGVDKIADITTSVVPESSVQLNNGITEKVKQLDQVDHILPVVESGVTQGTSSELHVVAPVPLDNSALTDDHKEKQQKLNLDEGWVKVKADEAGISVESSDGEGNTGTMPEKTDQEVKAPKTDSNSTASSNGKGKLSKSSSSSSSSSSGSSSSDSDTV